MVFFRARNLIQNSRYLDAKLHFALLALLKFFFNMNPCMNPGIILLTARGFVDMEV
jgi:hypothetical protein